MKVFQFINYFILYLILFFSTNLNLIQCVYLDSQAEDFTEICLDKLENFKNEVDSQFSEESSSIIKRFPNLQILTINELYYLINAKDLSMSMKIYDLQEDAIHDIILNQCKINQKWNSKETSVFYQMHVTNFEDENIPQRTFRINYLDMKNSIDRQRPPLSKPAGENLEKDLKRNSILINKIELISDNLGEINLKVSENPLLINKLPKLIFSQLNTNSTSFMLEEGDSVDFFINYNCNKFDFIKDWFDIKIRIQIDHKYIIHFEYVKICSFRFKQSTNFSYFLLILLFILVNFLCEKDFLIFNVHIIKINLEEIVHLKYAEIIIIVILIIIAILILLAILGLFTFVAYTAGFFLSLISIKFLLKSLIALIFPNFDYYASNQIWHINLLKVEIELSLSKVIYYISSFFILSLWLFYFNDVILTNFISFAVSYLLIKKIMFNNLYLIIGLYSFVIVYDIFYILTGSIYYGTYFNMNTAVFVNIPVKFFISEVTSTPFNIKYFFSIMDVIMIGFLSEYLKKFSTNIKNNKLRVYARYGMYAGLFLNFIFFYFPHLYFPFFFFPGLLMISTVIAYTVCNKEIRKFVYSSGSEDNTIPNKLRDIAKKLTAKKNSSYQMKIFTTDQSEDLKSLTPGKKKYVPPPFSIKEEIEDGKEESPSDNFLKFTKNQNSI